MYLELLISGSFKILFCVLIYMFLSAQVVLLLSCMYLCVCHWFSSYTWQSLVADVDSLYVGLSSWWDSSFVRMAGFEEDFIWSASIHNSSPGFPPSIYSDPLEKHSKAFFPPLFYSGSLSAFSVFWTFVEISSTKASFPSILFAYNHVSIFPFTTLLIGS